MSKTVREKAPEGNEALVEGMYAIIRLSRWAFEIAQEEGFTQQQAMELSKTYMTSLLTASVRK